MTLDESGDQFVWRGKFCQMYTLEKIQVGLNDAVRVSISSEQNSLGLFVCIRSHSYSVHIHFWLPLQISSEEDMLIDSRKRNVFINGGLELLQKLRPSLDITCKGLKFDGGKLHRM